MLLAVVGIRQRVRLQVPVTEMVSHVRSQGCEDGLIVSSDLAVALMLVSRCEVVLNPHQLAYFDEILRRKATTFVRNELRRRAVVERSGDNEVSIHLCCQGTLHRSCLRHLAELVINHYELFVALWRLHALAENINPHRR